jgi:hypothetical protein
MNAPSVCVCVRIRYWLYTARGTFEAERRLANKGKRAQLCRIRSSYYTNSDCLFWLPINQASGTQEGAPGAGFVIATKIQAPRCCCCCSTAGNVSGMLVVVIHCCDAHTYTGAVPFGPETVKGTSGESDVTKLMECERPGRRFWGGWDVVPSQTPAGAIRR